MVDTARSLTTLQSLFADNVSGDISPQDLRDFLVTAIGAYGSIVVIDGVGTQAITDTAVDIDQFTADGPYSTNGGVTPDYTSNNLTVGITGDYLVEFTVNYETNAILNTGFTFNVVRSIDTDDVLKVVSEHDGIRTIYSVSGSAIISCTSGEVVTLQVTGVPDSYNFDVLNATLVLKLIG